MKKRGNSNEIIKHNIFLSLVFDNFICFKFDVTEALVLAPFFVWTNKPGFTKLTFFSLPPISISNKNGINKACCVCYIFSKQKIGRLSL